jgi:hypothetical protein
MTVFFPFPIIVEVYALKKTCGLFVPLWKQDNINSIIFDLIIYIYYIEPSHCNLCKKRLLIRSYKSEDRQNNGQKKETIQWSTKHYTENFNNTDIFRFIIGSLTQFSIFLFILFVWRWTMGIQVQTNILVKGRTGYIKYPVHP